MSRSEEDLKEMRAKFNLEYAKNKAVHGEELFLAIMKCFSLSALDKSDEKRIFAMADLFDTFQSIVGETLSDYRVVTKGYYD